MLISLLGTALMLAGISTVGAQDNGAGEGGIKAGTLSCESIAGSKRNLLVTSTVQIACIYESGDVVEKYAGETGISLGIDFSFTSDEKMAWIVIAPSTDVSPGNHALAGKYYGARVEATVGVGVTANVLIGGFEKSFTLQPVSLGGQKGFGVAGGLGYMYLEPAK